VRERGREWEGVGERESEREGGRGSGCVRERVRERENSSHPRSCRRIPCNQGDSHGQSLPVQMFTLGLTTGVTTSPDNLTKLNDLKIRHVEHLVQI